MQLLVYTVVGLVAFMISYSFGLGAPVSALILLAIMFTGGLLRVAQPLLDRLRP